MLVVVGLIVAYGLAMLGSWTRINSAGMTCPDWPLCRGAVVPALHGGVVLEWMHRLLAFVETFVVAALVVAGFRLRRTLPIASKLTVALAGVFVLQVLLGGVTIFLANSPLSVMLHWGTAMLLLAVLASLLVIALTWDGRRDVAAFDSRATVPLLVAAAWAFATMCVGAFVSSSGAGLACPSVPGCSDEFLGRTGPQTLQMIHRFLAAALVVFAVAAAVVLPRSQRRATVAVRVALVLLALQITLGVLNVLWALPFALRELHAANAVATFLAFIVATVLASIETAGARISAPAHGRSAAGANV